MKKIVQEEPINRWWHWIRPYWHIGSTVIVLIFIVASNWNKVQAYNDRIISLEEWRIDSSRQQAEQSKDIAVMKQQVSDIHDYLIPRHGK